MVDVPSYFIELVCDGDRWAKGNDDPSLIALREVTTVRDLEDHFDWHGKSKNHLLNKVFGGF
ncbi:hypothetical protein Goe2_c15200 [Bacillus phage vB_BsuM-Goe2]|uniref:Uncharacterized protein n=1 Tax=Bacillus phage vB_BsuM-Goe2 TaxID=1933062 RepID=A0A217EQR1_9CAUD|nr:hypothetical protein Goe2_c15200 [Bacillus phage vB_BsuM-Goe2]